MSQLKIIRDPIDAKSVPEYFDSPSTLIYLLLHTEFDGFLASQLMFKLELIPLTKQLTNLAGNLWSRTLTGTRSDRNEHLLLHEFHQAKYVVPDKSISSLIKKLDVVPLNGEEDEEEAGSIGKLGKLGSNGSGRRKPAYAGGLVLEPKRGFYDKFVIALDFNSLYPSIIREFNICFTTVIRTVGEVKIPLPVFPFQPHFLRRFW